MIQAIRGMNDLLPDVTSHWQQVETTIRHLLASYGYQEIRLPILEKTELFKRSVGEVTDIVEKEMYTFSDRNNESLSLRPEGTAGCVRAGIEHGLLYNQIQRLWYMGPMFRHERPQQGRFRQFHQVGVEAFGITGPAIEAELICWCARLWQVLGLQKTVELQLNSLGSTTTRMAYREALSNYFQQHQSQLDADSQRRLMSNPLRILDSKNPAMAELNAAAPKLLDYLDTEAAAHFDELQRHLATVNIDFVINPCLVRGLDYYNGTVFEWVCHDLGAQATICAGGRYDGLVAQLGGKATPAVGFALGLERLLSLLTHSDTVQADIYLVAAEAKVQTALLLLAERLRDHFSQLNIISDCSNASLKSQFKRADQSGAKIALILGEQEIQQHQITLKYLRETTPQLTLPQADLMPCLARFFQK